MSVNNRIVTDKCDVCGERKLGTLVHDHQNVPVMFQCKDCQPNTFEKQAKNDIEAWLAGR
jgi:hypothetical protein